MWHWINAECGYTISGAGYEDRRGGDQLSDQKPSYSQDDFKEKHRC
jgi:hypothetical protein